MPADFRRGLIRENSYRTDRATRDRELAKKRGIPLAAVPVYRRMTAKGMSSAEAKAGVTTMRWG